MHAFACLLLTKHVTNPSLIRTHYSYEDYLDKQITPTDLYYLEDIELARQLVELG